MRQPPDNRFFHHVSVSNPNSAFSLPRRYIALIDTGATMCMVSPKVIDALSLTQIDAITYSSASESNVPTTVHLAEFAFKLTNNKTESGQIAVASMETNPLYDVILGMDILSHYRLEILRGVLTLEYV